MARLTEELLPAMPLDPELALFERDATEISTNQCKQLFHKSLIHAIARRSFIISNSALLCLGSRNAAECHLICVLLGSSTPLRGHKDYYKYVDDIYVDGYMYGKAIYE
jgi:hypothetical protein